MPLVGKTSLIGTCWARVKSEFDPPLLLSRSVVFRDYRAHESPRNSKRKEKKRKDLGLTCVRGKIWGNSKGWYGCDSRGEKRVKWGNIKQRDVGVDGGSWMCIKFLGADGRLFPFLSQNAAITVPAVSPPQPPRSRPVSARFISYTTVQTDAPSSWLPIPPSHMTIPALSSYTAATGLPAPGITVSRMGRCIPPPTSRRLSLLCVCRSSLMMSLTSSADIPRSVHLTGLPLEQQ